MRLVATIKLFPGVAEVADPKPGIEIDLDAILDRQADLLERWKILGREIQRRAERPLPFDIALELQDLIDETDA
jgi:hypothetical protein